MTDDFFPPLAPSDARQRFLLRDEQWDQRFKPGFDQFIVSTIEYARPIIKLPVPAGRTDNYGFFFVTGGTMQLSVGHQHFSITANQFVIVPAQHIFSISQISADATGYLCFFSQQVRNGAILSSYELLNWTDQPLIQLSDDQTRFVAALYDRLLIEYAEGGASRTDIIYPYLRAVVAEVNRAYPARPAPDRSSSEWLVTSFQDLLRLNAQREGRVSQYATWLNVSPNHLNKVLKARTGKSPSVWIDERQVLEAKVLLYQTSLSIGQIAEQLRFSDQAAFGKLFRKVAGMSPSVFRRMIDSA